MASLYRTSCESPWNSALIAAHPPSCSSNLAIKSRTRLEHLEWSAIKRLRTKVINCDWKEACKTRGAAPLKAAGLLGAASARQTVAGVFWIVSFFFFFFHHPLHHPQPCCWCCGAVEGLATFSHRRALRRSMSMPLVDSFRLKTGSGVHSFR